MKRDTHSRRAVDHPASNRQSPTMPKQAPLPSPYRTIPNPIEPRSKRKAPISKPIRRAVEAIIWEGLGRAEAAERAGIKEDTLYRALRRPHVLKLMKEEHVKLRQGAPFKAYSRIERMAEQADSEHVKMDANKWIAGVDGLAPVSKLDVQANVRHSFVDYDYSEAVDITPDEPIIDANES